MAHGETLLIGGVENGRPVSLQKISLDRSATQDGLHSYFAPRFPFAAQLASGEIFIAGGIDSNGAQVKHIEILSADASNERLSTDFFQTLNVKAQAFVALSGGGALGVIDILNNDGTETTSAIRVSADYVVRTLTISPSFKPADFRLFRANCGGALLWTGTEWRVFDPWDEQFVSASVPSSGPESGPSFATDPSLAMWITNDGHIAGRRFSIRNDYSSEINPALTTRLCSFASLDARGRPLAPDRSPSTDLSKLVEGQVYLPPDEAAFVTDATYANFSLDADVVSGTAPRVALRTADATFTIGGADCALAQAGTIHIERAGAIVRVREDGVLRACNHALASGRVSIGFAGSENGSTFRNVRIVRTLSAP